MIDEQDLDVLCYNTHSTTLPTTISMVRTLDLVEDDELDDIIDINTLDRNDPFSNSVSSASLEFSTPIEPMIPFILTGELDDNSDNDTKNLIGSCKSLFGYLGAAVLSMLFFFISNGIKSLINYINPNAELVTIDPIYKTSSIIINTFIYSGFGSVVYGLHKFITYKLHNKLTKHEQKIEQLEKEKRIFIKNCKKYTNKLDRHHKHVELFMQQKTELGSHIISEANETCDLIKVQLEDLQQNLSHSITEELHITKLNIAVDNITKDIRQFKNTIKNASKLYKLAQNNIVIKDSDFTLNMLKDMVFTKVEKHASQKHLSLLYVTSLPSSIIFSGETNKIASILIHFISNAIKFTEKGFVKLIIREDIEHGQALAQESKKLLHFAVQDTGKGIETSELHYMFRPYKTDDLSPEKAEGTGLGLCLVSALVKHINNEYPFKHSKQSFGVRSMVGRGSIFWCRLWVSINPVTVATINPTPHNPLSNNVATTILKHHTFLKEQSTFDLNSNGSESCLMPPSPGAQSLQAFKNQLLLGS